MNIPADCNFILRRYDKVPTIPFRVHGYQEQARSVPFDVNGITACTLFIKQKGTRDIALQSGWKDETEKVRTQLAAAHERPVKKEPVVIMRKRGRPRKK